MGFFFEIIVHCFKILEFQDSFIICKWSVMYMTYNKIVIYDTINQSLQYLMYFGMI